MAVFMLKSWETLFPGGFGNLLLPSASPFSKGKYYCQAYSQSCSKNTYPAACPGKNKGKNEDRLFLDKNLKNICREEKLSSCRFPASPTVVGAYISRIWFSLIF